MTSVLITGASGQDGSYLIDLLRSQGYAIHAQSRSGPPTDAATDVIWHVCSLTEPYAIERLLGKIRPDEIYNLAAVSRPALAWTIPSETTELNAVVPQRICEWIARNAPATRLFQASSSEIFGDSDDAVQTETTCLRPRSIYGISKAFAHQMAGAYRTHYGLHVSCGILFNHESPRRPLGFVVQKIAHAAAAISLGKTETAELDERGRPIVRDGKLALGNIQARRDFSFAGDVARAMHMMVRAPVGDDFVIGSGETHSIADVCASAFGAVGLDWTQHVTTDDALLRPVDATTTRADPGRIKQALGWHPTLSFAELVGLMVKERRELLDGL